MSRPAPHRQRTLFDRSDPRPALEHELTGFHEFGTATRVLTTTIATDGTQVPTFVNEFWTSKQRAANALHEVSYRACFKPQLPRFFIERLTLPGEVVHDPFMGRGTTPIEAALLGRTPAGSDINPLATLLTRPRLRPPQQADVEARLKRLPLERRAEAPDDLLAFYHPATLAHIAALRRYLNQQEPLDPVDDWIRMVALNRLTGHSTGFFSVYTLPPNQATSVAAQRKINQKRQQTPPRRDVLAILARKSRQLLKELTSADRATLQAQTPQLFTAAADHTPGLRERSVALVVTSPPFLDVVQYHTDNWLRCWFAGIDPQSVSITQAHSVVEWQTAMAAAFRELWRVVRPGGHVAFEVGEVRKGTVQLEQHVVPAAVAAGFTPRLLLINDQKFTKTAHCWGIDNNQGGTNTNRIVLLQR